VSLLDRKLLRDLAALPGRVVTIAALVAVGVGVFVAAISTYDSLQSARDRFYAESRFPQIFVTLKRAPLSVARRIADIPGVAASEARIVRDVIVDWPPSRLPVSARVVSLAHAGEETLAALRVASGVAPESGDARTAIVNEAFAAANGLVAGDRLRVLLNGKLETFKISGTAQSAEYVYAVKPGSPIPDDRTFAVLWVDRAAAEAAFGMSGAFNDVVVALAPKADAKRVMADLDRLLEPYGSTGAIERRDQTSNRFLEDELNQQRVMSTTIPLVFFAIAAFILNVALGRLVSAQREQIAALKALGFPTFPLAAHFLKLVAVIVLIGWALGLLVGYGFGQSMMASYHEFLRLPGLRFAITPWSALASGAVSLAAATIGALNGVANVVALTPAEAMRPPAPRAYHALWSGGGAGRRVLAPRWMMIARNVLGRPLRSALSIVAVAFAVPMVALGLFWRDAIDRMTDVQFSLVERGNVAVTFAEPRDRAIISDLEREPGVLAAEGLRTVPVRLTAAQHEVLTQLIGLPAAPELRQPHDVNLRPVAVSPDGLTLSQRLAERLGVAAGDSVAVQALEGRRRQWNAPVSATVEEPLGMASYMNLGALNRLTGEGDVVSGASVATEPGSALNFAERLKSLPTVSAVAVKSLSLASFLDKIAGLVFVTAGILTAFAVVIAVGVVYNGASISLQERARELASLRVLGFSRAEVANVLFGQFAIELAAGVPTGLVLSRLLVGLIARFHSNESFQIPAVIEPRTYATAAIVVIAAAAASAYAVRRRIDRLDLVAVLKTRD
jgi:putative ABC transport system permease protein